MTYYYDSEARVMIAVDPETEEVRILEAINFEDDEPELKSVKVKPAPKLAKQPGKGCPECSSTTKHRKGCSQAGVKKEKKMTGNKAWKDLGEVSSPKAKMTRMEYGRVKIANSHDIPNETVANDMKLSEAEVSKAIEAETYDEYQSL